MDWITPLLILAQEGQAPAEEGGFDVMGLLFPMVLIFILFYFMILLPQRKEQERVRKLSEVKEKDQILTTGGIYGVVTNVQKDAGRITLRVDEATGTKIKISLGAVAQILSDKDEAKGKE